ncbi:pre-rRNA processing [Ceratocystis pirilliformis]|uniref:Pre-rRNA processing n=1 Tax=Ceratocystis pirilliformis TaxID=259994 RepID=A0ABR3YNI5_9PEZI
MATFDRLESEDQFWQALDDCLTKRCRTNELIDHTLRTWLYLVAAVRDALLHSEDDVANCAHKLMGSLVFDENKDYVRQQLISNLLQEDECAPLHVVAWFMLLDGRLNPDLFRLMIQNASFPRLTELISRHGRGHGDVRLHRLLLELMFEMSRIERLRREDLVRIDDAFVAHLLQAIDSVSDDAHDNPTIKVLLVLNEQYMLASTSVANVSSTQETPPEAPLTNRVIKLLSLEGSSYRNFGENIIMLLNREAETSYQLLILKVLYLLFTNRTTYEYFYTNDLKVLVDIILRNLMDLPEDKASLRHTYLRVLYPLLAHTQLNQPHSHYKRKDILAILSLVAGQAGSINAHFAPTDETTLRLVERVRNVEWLRDAVPASGGESRWELGQYEKANSLLEPETDGSQENLALNKASDARKMDKGLAQRLLGMSLSPSETSSMVSVSDVAAVQEKPGVTTPSRIAVLGGELPNVDIDGVVAGELPTGVISNSGTPSRANSLTPAEAPVIAIQNASPSPTPSGAASITSRTSSLGSIVPGRLKKPRPQVPKHRHGVLIGHHTKHGGGHHSTTTASATTIPSKTATAEEAAAVSANQIPTSHELGIPNDAGEVSSVTSSASTTGKAMPKRIPPKAPPPRRQRLSKPSIDSLALAAQQSFKN